MEDSDLGLNLQELLQKLHGHEGSKDTPSPASREIYEELVDELGEEALHGKRLPCVPSPREVRDLIEVAPPVRDRLIIRLLYSSGMRVGELTALKKAHVRPSQRLVFIDKGKGTKDRYVCVDPKTMRMLKDWLEDKPEEAHVFDVEDRQINRIVKKYGDVLGLVKKYDAMGRSFSPHSLRHSFATHCYENHMDLLTLRKLLGHRYLTTTEIYIYTAMKYTRKVYRHTHELCIHPDRAGNETDES